MKYKTVYGYYILKNVNITTLLSFAVKWSIYTYIS